MLDEGMSPIDIMITLGLDTNKMTKILEQYNKIYALLRPSGTVGEENVTLQRIFGEKIRDTCDYYDESGVCVRWRLNNVDPAFRQAHPDMFKTVGKVVRFYVLKHPEICMMCRRGKDFGE